MLLVRVGFFSLPTMCIGHENTANSVESCDLQVHVVKWILQNSDRKSIFVLLTSDQKVKNVLCRGPICPLSYTVNYVYGSLVSDFRTMYMGSMSAGPD